MKTQKRVAWWLVCALSACGGAQSNFETTTTQPVTASARSAHDEAVAEGEAAWAERADEARLRACIAAWQRALESDASDIELWGRLTRAQYFLADGHLAFDTARDAETLEAYLAAVRTAEHGLSQLSPEFAQSMNAGNRIEQSLALLDVRAVPLLYWRSSAQGKWARRDGFATLLSVKDEIRAVMSRVLELDRTYFYTGPDRYFGAFFAVAPAYAGGDLDRSRTHFEYSLGQAPNYLGTHVLYATEYAVKTQDRALFQRELDLVIAADPAVIPELEPENRVEQRKAREALARIDEFFE